MVLVCLRHLGANVRNSSAGVPYTQDNQIVDVEIGMLNGSTTHLGRVTRIEYYKPADRHKVVE